MQKIGEECGVFGIFSPTRQDVAKEVYYGLYALQHRGQEACGIVVNDDGVFTLHKDNGLVNDVFSFEQLEKLGHGNMALGHVRYGTSGGRGRENAQPILVNHIKGSMAVSHNGNLVNSYQLRSELEEQGLVFHTTSDTEVISYVIIKERISCGSVEEAVDRAMYKIKGAYSMCIMSPTKMIAARDENGFRPLCYGKKKDGSYVIASETCALDTVGAEFIRDIEPGEIVIFSSEGIRSIKTHCGKAKKTLCIFEYIYFSRPDSVINGCCVHDARVESGKFLARAYPVDADVVIGAPDSGIDAALGYSFESGIRYETGFLKNKYIGRTFIAPGQKTREDKVRIKLNAIKSVVNGKRVVLVDDSIVRGTTCARTVNLLREAGAKEVHMRVAAPPFKNPCYYGTDIPDREYLIANQHTVEEIRQIIGVDTLGYLTLDYCKNIACGKDMGFCMACFDGNYPTETPIINEKFRFEKKLSEKGNK